MSSIALLANPESGSGEADEVERLLGELGADVRRFGLDQADEAVAARPERIVVAGGDGSIGCAAAAASRAGVPLAVVAVGTANDFARAHELPGELEHGCRLALEGEKLLTLELARLGERPFVNVASAGLPPVAARKAHGLKKQLGALAYVVGGLRAALTAEPVRCRIACDGEEFFSGPAWQVTVASSGAFGGGSEVDADPADGRLDLVVVEARARVKLIARGYGLRRGTLERQEGVHSCRGNEIEVSTDGSTGFNVDGEGVDVESARFTAEPAAFSLVVG